MANSGFNEFGFNPDLYLNSTETDLLVAALESNKPSTNPPTNATGVIDGLNGSTTNKQNKTNRPNVGSELSHHPYLDFDTSEGWDWNLRGLPERFDDDDYPQDAERKDSLGSEDDDEGDKLQSPTAGDDGDIHDKRKNSEDPDDVDGGGKRQETDSKNGKKQSQRPGRKPLTSEPTTKRKAQNRAAQRAFRERKEKHLKDLETKVEELEKASESTNHENSLLRAKVERLQTEVKEYRKQMSLSASSSGGSPIFSSLGQPLSARTNWDISNNFNFEFPKFGALADGKVRSPSLNAGLERNNASNSASLGPQRSNTINGPTSMSNDLSSLFPSDILTKASNRTMSGSSQSKKSIKDTSRSSVSAIQNSADSNSASPASSGSNVGFTSSSCATTPEATCETPDQQKDTGLSPRNDSSKGSKFDSSEAFCKDFQTACGTTENPIPVILSNSSNEAPALTPALTTQSQDSSLDFNGFDWLANQNGGAFDPILFGDYREPQENIMNNDLNFFNDAFPSLTDFSSPDVQPQTQPLQTNLPKKKDLMQEIEERQAGKDPEVVPGDERQQFLTCNLLWDRVQRSQRVQSGEADMDDLCTQLKAKAKCSGSGAVISQSDVDAILGPSAAKEVAASAPDYLKMFK